MASACTAWDQNLLVLTKVLAFLEEKLFTRLLGLPGEEWGPQHPIKAPSGELCVGVISFTLRGYVCQAGGQIHLHPFKVPTIFHGSTRMDCNLSWFY